LSLECGKSLEQRKKEALMSDVFPLVEDLHFLNSDESKSKEEILKDICPENKGPLILIFYPLALFVATVSSDMANNLALHLVFNVGQRCRTRTIACVFKALVQDVKDLSNMSM